MATVAAYGRSGDRRRASHDARLDASINVNYRTEFTARAFDHSACTHGVQFDLSPARRTNPLRFNLNSPATARQERHV